MTHIAVIGGGIAGLAAAHRIANTPGASVTLIESEPTLGGKIRSSSFAGIDGVDEGADAFLARVPWAVDVAREVGLGDQLTSPAVSKASIWFDTLHPLPPRLVLGMPTGVRALATSRLLSWSGKARAATEPLRRATTDHGDSLGRFVRARFGDEVHERLVDPLIGSIYAADTDNFSLRAVPQIDGLATTTRSVLLGARRHKPDLSGPVFFSPRRGMASLVDALADDIQRAGGTLRCGHRVAEIAPDTHGWRVDDIHVDAVVLACPAATARRLMGGEFVPTIDTADVAIVTLAVPRDDWPTTLVGQSGYLVPKPRQRLVTAVSFGSQKWAHWDNGRDVILRISLGRDGLPVDHLDDHQLVAAALADVGGHLNLQLNPTATRITRWPMAFPQYRPGHFERLAIAEARLPSTLAIAGASYHGIGVPACIRSGQLAGARLLGVAH